MSEGSIFTGLGLMVLAFVLAWGVYHIFRMYKMLADNFELYDNVETVGVHKVLKKVGLDLDEELVKLNIKNTKSFKKIIQDKIIEEYFAEKTKKR